jgi:manganese/iron transport system substrate-binding protein
MKRWILAGLLFGLIACNASIDRSPDAKPRVVSTSTILADLTERVGGEEIDHTGILKPGTDPHVYEPVPADNIALEKADLIFYNGYNLEPGLIKLMDSAGVNARKVAIGEVVTPLDIRKEGRSVPDPHVWGDARNGIAMTRKIRDELIRLSPADKAVFTENADRLIAELEKLDTWIKASIRTIPSDRRRLVTTHDAFQYYAKAYGLSVTGTLIGISTEEQPSARTVKDLALAIQNTKVPAIFAETTINPALIITVAREAGVKLAPRQLYSDSIGPADGDAGSYGKMLAANTRTIVEALGGKFVPGPE